LIVNVETTPATTPDDPMVAVVHASLAKRNRLPAEHLVDKGYTDAQALLDSQQGYRVRLVGPVANDPSWQARAGTGFDKSQFNVDWERQVVTCPAGKPSVSWLGNTYPKNGVVWEARFARQDCTPCPFGHSVPMPKWSLGSSAYKRENSMKPCRRPGDDKRPKPFGKSMRRGPGSKVPMSKPFAGVDYATRAISAWPKRACSMSSPPWP
jgi:hypothetical protein